MNSYRDSLARLYRDNVVDQFWNPFPSLSQVGPKQSIYQQPNQGLYFPPRQVALISVTIPNVPMFTEIKLALLQLVDPNMIVEAIKKQHFGV